MQKPELEKIWESAGARYIPAVFFKLLEAMEKSWENPKMVNGCSWMCMDVNHP
jgi:hypothetical protein